jgi:alkylhydroperoxidase family enzyme
MAPLVRPLTDAEVAPDVQALFRVNTRPVTRREKLALRPAETIAHDPNGLGAELREARHEELTDAQVVELAFAPAMFYGAGRMVAAMGLTLAAERREEPR